MRANARAVKIACNALKRHSNHYLWMGTWLVRTGADLPLYRNPADFSGLSALLDIVAV